MVAYAGTANEKGDFGTMAMYVYTVGGGNLTIRNPNCPDMSKVKNTVREQRPDRIEMRSEYPDGLALEIIQTARETIVYSNRELTEHPDGSLAAPSA